MLIYRQALPNQLKKKHPAVFVLVGTDPYLIDESASAIKCAWQQSEEVDIQLVEIQSPNDWLRLPESANSYSLLATKTLLDIRFNKKILDKTGKETLQAYLKKPNHRCLILIHAPLTAAKQWSWSNDATDAIVLHLTPLTEQGFKSWLNTELKATNLQYDRDVPDLIHDATQNNMVAAKQTIEKLMLTFKAGEKVTIEQVQAHLSQQSEYQLYEFTDACLLGKLHKALHVLRHARQTSRVEPTLILWLITQEIRRMIQLSTLLKANVPIAKACGQLKIWPKKAPFYQGSLKRGSTKHWQSLLVHAQQLDEAIKSSQVQTWERLEELVLMFILPSVTNS